MFPLKKIFSSFAVPGKDNYAGYEFFFVSGRWGYFIRAFYSPKKTDGEKLKTFIESIEFKGSDI